MKKTISFLLSLFIIFSMMTLIENVYADDELISYSGSTTASWGYTPHCTFTLTNVKNSRFRGIFIASNLGNYSFSENVEGVFYSSNHSFTCIFTVNFYNNSYYSNITITAYPEEGYCDCHCVGSWHMEDFKMYGTPFLYGSNDVSITGNEYYNEDDMILCANLSAMIYDNKSKYSFVKNNSNFLNTNNIETEDVKYYNYLFDTNSNNVAFALMNIIENEQTAKMIVVIRGTYNDEWQGNMQITGASYNPDSTTHFNFDKAAKSIKSQINSYYNYLKRQYQYVYLMITGHSRGAAVANLYAKSAIDKINGSGEIGIPNFHSVIAYTFACPNVAIYSPYMENYISIFNFGFYEDLIPTIPLTKPTSGWNYWKYGKTYCASLTDSRINGILTNKNKIIKDDYVDTIHSDFSKWESVERYYNKILYGTKLINNIPISVSTTMYNFAYDATGAFKSHSIIQKEIAIFNLKNRFGMYPSLNKIIIDAGKNVSSISGAHSQYTYLNVINRFGDSVFDYYSYNSAINNHYLTSANNFHSNNHNSSETNALISLYNTYDNSSLLDWDVTDPSTWTGITWNSSGNVTAIDLQYLDLEGLLDLSDFSAIESVNLAGNKLTSIDLTDCDSLINLNVSSNNLASLDVSDCTELETLDCSFNDLSTDGLDVSANTALITLKCDDCGLTTLNVSTLTALEELSCAFNELTTINVDNNTALTSLTCCYNYMDTHEGGTLYNKFDDLLFSDVYVNYYPQAIPDNATFNTSELNALKTFALTENNNAALDWLDENDSIDTDKLQNNVLFEYDGSAYRIVTVDLADTEVEGALNLTALTKLKELYCENTNISSLNVNSCTVLNTLSCDNCEISSLTLPSNAAAKNTPLYDVSCEYNYIDTRIFTDTMVDYITFKAGAKLEYENQKGDNSALVAVMEFSDTLSSNDYSESSFSIFSEIIEDYEDYENLLLTQTDIDEIVTEILTSINSLEPYLDLDISAPHGTFTVTYYDELQNGNTHSLLFGTPVTLTATADEGYVFDGWYEKVTQRKFSSNSTYTFKITTNMDLEARFVRTGDVTLTFTNDTGQVVAKIDKSVSEWNEVTSIGDLLPEVPYKLGHTNGRWNYTEEDVLTALQVGNDVTITPIYDDSTYEYPTVPTPTDNVPVINLYYSLDADNNVGSFTMAAGIPQDLNIEAIGIGFYYKKAASFNPSNFILNINNKMLTSRFDNTDSDGIYIVNINKFTSAYNWCARGYITYYDENNELKTVYSNQINIVNREQIV